MSDIYKENILDHYKNPRNSGSLDNPDIQAKDSNPLCGDVIEIQISIDGDKRVADVKFTARGCAISQASASMLTEMIKGKKLDELERISKEDIIRMLGVDLGPVRIKCGLLSLKVLKLGVYSYKGKEIGEEIKGL